MNRAYRWEWDESQPRKALNYCFIQALSGFLSFVTLQSQVGQGNDKDNTLRSAHAPD